MFKLNGDPMLMHCIKITPSDWFEDGFEWIVFEWLLVRDVNVCEHEKLGNEKIDHLHPSRRR